MSKKIIVKNPNNLPTTSYKNLKDLQGNLKTISKENLEKLKQSILKYGIFVPKFVWIENNKNYWIEDGHQTIKALVALEKEDYIISDIPYVKIEASDKKDAAEKLLQINSRYGIINPETTFFEDFDIDLSFIENIEIPELDIKLEELESEIAEDEVPEPPTEPLSKMGDLWLCGKHRILCGDATKEVDILKLMDGKKADMVFTDPPYNIDYIYETYDDNKKEIDYFQLIEEAIQNTIISTKENIAFYIMCANKNAFDFKEMFKNQGLNFHQFLYWVKNHFGYLGRSDYQHNYETICYGWKGKHYFYGKAQNAALIIDRDLGKNSVEHHAQRPIVLLIPLISNSSIKNQIIIVFFLGSGTTLIAAHQTGRICYGCEIDPHYIDVILDRYAKFTGDDPIRESDGVKWSELNKKIQM